MLFLLVWHQQPASDGCNRFGAGGGQGFPHASDAFGRPHPWPPLGLAVRLPCRGPEGSLAPVAEDLAALVPDARLVVAAQSEHFIPGDQPELMIVVIRLVDEAVCNPSRQLSLMASPVP